MSAPRSTMKWTTELDAKLKALMADGLTAAICADIMGATEGSIYARASSQSFKFQSDECQAVAKFLALGGRLIREDVGGVVGVRWARAHRSGPGFPAPICERLLELGRLTTDHGNPSIFCAA